MRNSDKLLRWILSILIVVWVWLIGLPASASQNVLIIHSYHEGFEWTDSIMKGVDSIFGPLGGTVETHVEYMDSKRHTIERSYEFLRNTIQSKYRNIAFNLIVLSDDNALSFYKENVDLFGRTPTVFCGVNQFSPDMIDGLPWVTGVVEAVDIPGTIRLARKLIPRLSEVVVITDETPTGKANQKLLAAAIPLFEGEILFTTISGGDLSMEELKEELLDLSADTAVLVMNFHKDEVRSYYNEADYITQIVQASSRPVFGLWKHYMDYGVLGGSVVNGMLQGQEAAQVGMRLLVGEKISEIPVKTDSPNRTMINYSAFSRYGLSESNIPENAIVVGKPDTLYERYTLVFWVGLVAVVLQTIAIIYLLVMRGARRAAERNLHKTEQRFRLMAENMPVLIHAHDESGLIIYWNATCERVLGWTNEDIIGNPDFLNCLYPEPDLQDRVRRIHLGEMSYGDLELPVRTKNGGKRLIQWIDATQYVAVPGWTSWEIGVDNTERHIAESKLRDSEQRHRVIFEKSPMGMIRFSKEGVILDCNEHFAELMGAPVEQLIGFNSAKHSTPAMRAVLKRALAGESTSFEDYYVSVSGGKKTYLNVQFNPVEDGVSPTEVIATLWDASERKAAQDELRKAKDQAERFSRSKSEFLTNMSHEIRTPLNGILGMLQLMETTGLNSEQHEYVDAAVRSSERLANLLADILDLSRVEAGKLIIQYSPFSLRDSLQQICDMYRLTGEHRAVRLECRIDESLPQFVQGDAIRLQQVLTNLVGNAYKFTEKGSISLEAYVQGRMDYGECRVLFTVADTGIGIPDDKIESLFESFTQVSEGYTRSYQGAGLGLAICKRLVELMNGTLAIDSELGVGTTLYVSLPFAVAEQEVTVSDTESARGQGSQLSGLRILLAEDERVNSTVTNRLLEKSGHHVEVVENGRQAIAALQEDAFDVVLMDIQMPVMDGVEATKAIRGGQAGDRAKDIPIVAVTAYAMVGDREKFMAEGMDGYVVKPIEMDKMQATLGLILGAK
ncbi:putative Histidine kinase [Pseudodesulfovibrio profundus]|uniref:histidine kinase n=2 Tax=Pseudodesulfovibrio profundus TaxID=57320 RepID=A0A2C8F774_9BACT|nr:putative Histidine kinase [Pseudodesulfovibrio profundus]